MYGHGRRLERDPVDADGRPIPQWGEDVTRSMTAEEMVAAQERGHFNRYLLGDVVESVEAPARPEQYAAEQVSALSREELLAAHKAGHLDDWVNSPRPQSAGGAEL